MSSLDDLLGSQLASAGVLFPRRQFINIVSGAQIVDNPGANRTDLTVTPAALFVSTGNGPTRGLISYQASTDPVGARFILEKSRGSVAVPTDLIAGDEIGGLAAFAWSSGAADFQSAGGIRWRQVQSSATGSKAVREDYFFDAGGSGLDIVVDNLQYNVAQTANASAFNMQVVLVPSGTAVTIDVEWHGRIIPGTTEAFRQSTALFRRVGAAAPVQMGTTVDRVPTIKDDATWGTPNFVVSGNDIAVQVTGKAATSINWDCKVRWRIM